MARRPTPSETPSLPERINHRAYIAPRPALRLCVINAQRLGLSKTPSLHDNLIIEGDNLKALKALLPTYHGKVKCIYIDPPYNTGKEGWIYNDKVNSPMIRDWLGRTVDRDDLTRHDKWCSMILPRFKLLRDLLSSDGIIFVSISDVEVHHLRCLMDEVFEERNFITDFIWNSEGHTDNQFPIKVNHEHIIAYARSADSAVVGNVVDPNTREESNLWKGFA